MAFGGAGPLHACELAEEMQIPRVLIPPSPGVLSALGMLVARPARDYSLTVMEQLRPAAGGVAGSLAGRYTSLRAEAEADMVAEGYAAGRLQIPPDADPVAGCSRFPQ